MASTSTMIQMDHWSNSQASLSDAERISVNTLSNWLASDVTSATKMEEARGSSSAGMPSRPTTASSMRMAGPSLPSAPLVDAPLYLSWFAKQQSHITSSSQSSHTKALQSLTHAADEADVLLDHLEAARVHISELRAGARFVEEGSEGLREEAESMVEKIDHLSHLAQALALRLSYFAILPASTLFLSSPSLSLVTSTDFLFTLDRLDVALAFVDAHPHYRDSPLYKMRFEHCVLRAGTLIRMYTLARWKEVSNEVATKMRTWEKARSTKGKEKESDVSDDDMMHLIDPSVSVLLWDRFEEEGPSLRPLLAELEKRASLLAAPASTDIESHKTEVDESLLLADYSRDVDEQEDDQSAAKLDFFRSPEFVTLLTECRVGYFDARRSLLSGIISNCLAQIEVLAQSDTASPAGSANRTTTPLASFIRRSVSFISAICEREVSLCSQFFAVDQNVNSIDYKEMPSYIQSLCALLDDRIRTRLAREVELSSIAAACLALVGDRNLEVKSSALVYSNLSTGMLKEVQDRLLARARMALAGSSFVQFIPKDEDIDYPSKLRKTQSHRRGQSSIGGAGLLEAALEGQVSAQRGFKQMDELSPSTSSVRLFAAPAKSIVSSWYPPLASTLSLLSATNDALPNNDFIDLAYSAVDACRICIAKAGEMMASQGGFGSGRIGLSGRMDVPLFLLRHYFLLREILASIELRKASKGMLQVDRRTAGAALSLTSSSTGTIIDFAKLVETLNLLWTGIRGYGGGAATKRIAAPILESIEESQIQESTSSSTQHSALEADLAKASDQMIDVVVQGVTLPLRVYMDQRSRPFRSRQSVSSNNVTSPPLKSPTQEPKSPLAASPASPLKKVQSAVKAFETCAQTSLTEANEAMKLYLEDNRAINSLAEPIISRIMETFTTFVTSLGTAGINLSEVSELKKPEEERARLTAAIKA